MFTMLCINGTTPHPLPRPFPFGCVIFFFCEEHLEAVPPSGLAGGSAYLPLGVPASPSPSPSPVVLFPLPWFSSPSLVYISSPRRGARTPRDMILSLVLAPGALHKELGEGGGTGNGTRAEAGAEIGAG
uniref:Uncharacterized protein n=1 Tax=Balaenoptera musculus TaxID=9771 RepID=A0A8C0DAW8_BALMU